DRLPLYPAGREDVDGMADAAEHLLAKLIPIPLAAASELLARHDRSLVDLGQCLEPGRLVDGRAEDREGQPVDEPDIAEHHVADVQPDAIADLALAALLSLRVGLVHPLGGDDGGRVGLAAGLAPLLRAVAAGED